MCTGIPGRVVSVMEMAGGSRRAMVEFGGGRTVAAELMLVPEVGVGDHVIVHSGYAITAVAPETVEATLTLLAETEQLSESDRR